MPSLVIPLSFILILSSHLNLGFSVISFLQVLPTKNLHDLSFAPGMPHACIIGSPFS